METLIAPTINFLILVGALAYYLHEPLKSFVANRHVSIRDEVKNVREMLSKAQEQFDEFSAKLKAIDVEIAALRDQARQEAQASKVRVLNDAQKLSTQIVSDARLAAQGLFAELRSHLSSELGARVLDRAEALLKDRLTADDRSRIRKEFSNQVETVQ